MVIYNAQHHDQDRLNLLYRPVMINDQIEDGEICRGTEHKA